MLQVEVATARDFLKSNRFEDLVHILVEKHKVQVYLDNILVTVM